MRMVVNVVDHISGATYIGRRCGGLPESIWANPFKLTECIDRTDCISKYKNYLKNNPDLLHKLPLLSGRVLQCWCAPNACHGDVLSLYAHREDDKIRIMVTGSRPVSDPRYFEERIRPFLVETYVETGKRIVLIHGNARGVDRNVAAIASDLGWEVLAIPAIWEDKVGNFDRGAGHKRNVVMIALADEVIGIWDGESPGTKNAIDLAKKENKLRHLFMA